MNKIYFCGMSGPGSLENLKELIEPISEFIHGVIWTLHDSVGSEEEKYLESVKGDGKVIHYYYSGRHDVSRNQYLWCGPLKNGDYILTCDDLERINKDFAASLPSMIKTLKEEGINCLYFYGKPLFFEYHESMIYSGSPHEGLMRRDGKMSAIEYANLQPDESKVRLNVRPLKRKDPFHWVPHYARYMLMPWGSNHSLLGLEHRGNIQELFPKRDAKRLAFLEEIDRRGFERTLDGLEKMFSGELDQKLKQFINEEKVWNDFYRYKILGDKTVIDGHTQEVWNQIIKI